MNCLCLIEAVMPVSFFVNAGPNTQADKAVREWLCLLFRMTAHWKTGSKFRMRPTRGIGLLEDTLVQGVGKT